jgi:hypothetical protein
VNPWDAPCGSPSESVTGSHHCGGRPAAVTEFDFAFDRLRHAAVTLPRRADPFAPPRRLLRSVHGADHVRMLTYPFLPEGDPAASRCFVEEGQSFEGVPNSTPVRSLLADPASITHLRELLAGDTRVGVASEPVPVVFAIAAEQVVVGTVDDYLARAEQLGAEDVSARAATTDGGT